MTKKQDPKIVVKEKTKRLLDKSKIVSTESYDSVISRLLKNANKK